MQPVKRRFRFPDQGRHGSLQSCVRMDDIDLVGDGTHLTHFEMLGNFSFGGNDYDHSVGLWHSLLTDLGITGLHIHVHPTQTIHRRLWSKRGYEIKLDERCVWSDGEIGGYCCELFLGDLEIGNLVNPLGHSTDVGFGWERLNQVVERKDRIEQTSLFENRLHPILSDHSRTVSVLLENGIEPGNRGRNYVCRRLLRRMLTLLDGSESFDFEERLHSERLLRERSLQRGKKYWRKHKNQPPSFWWETFGILPEELKHLK